MRKCQEEETETPGRERLFLPGVTAKRPSKGAAVWKPEQFMNKVKDSEERVMKWDVLLYDVNMWFLLVNE